MTTNERIGYALAALILIAVVSNFFPSSEVHQKEEDILTLSKRIASGVSQYEMAQFEKVSAFPDQYENKALSFDLFRLHPKLTRDGIIDSPENFILSGYTLHGTYVPCQLDVNGLSLVCARDLAQKLSNVINPSVDSYGV